METNLESYLEIKGEYTLVKLSSAECELQSQHFKIHLLVENMHIHSWASHHIEIQFKGLKVFEIHKK